MGMPSKKKFIKNEIKILQALLKNYLRMIMMKREVLSYAKIQMIQLWMTISLELILKKPSLLYLILKEESHKPILTHSKPNSLLLERDLASTIRAVDSMIVLLATFLPAK